ncbi:hypothetical protein HTZ84_22450 [Haloterrigena sp. SYSU A558-1]|uniref:Uncharacterized protein n=1 Tax=Haloterrigena gelatinilytica TaxID=2741724 RepID=A0ABX2LPG5_9EURY|nr:hypothetical protein [Haloterrigena gelatinilytica]NUC75029.1 hypothetical protein [Haloterrigena gelatinilytica]
MNDSYQTDTSLWCSNGHDPKLPDRVDGTLVCRYCGREYEVSVSVEVRSTGAGVDRDE